MPGTNEWPRLYKSLEVQIPKGQKPRPKPSSEMIREFEQRSGFRLPRTYREFISVFGPGELGSGFNIKAPGLPKLDRSHDLEVFTKGMRDILRRNYPTDEQMSRLVYFCETSGADLIGWDPADVREAAGNEYGIYIVIHEKSQCEFLGGSFSDFVYDMCLGTAIAHILGIKPSDLGPVPRRFRPVTGRPRSK